MLLSKEELDKTSVLREDIAERLAKIPRPAGDVDIVAAIRAGLKAMSAAVLAQIGPTPEGVSEQYHDIPMRDGYMNSLKIQKPSNASPGPVVVFAYGGGFIGGTNDQLAHLGRALVKLYDATVVSVSYRHAPEDKFPIQPYDTWDSLKWIAENATGALLGADPSEGFIMGGMSAGGCLTVVLSRKLQEEPLAHPLTGQWLSGTPTMDYDTCPDKYKSYYIAHEQNAGSPVMTQERFQMLAELTGWDMHNELRNTGRSQTPLSGQPKTYFQVEGQDILRDDGLIYEEMLKEAGVPTKIDLYPGCVHGTMFHMMGTELGNRILIDAVIGLAWLLDKTVSREEAAAAVGAKSASSEGVSTKWHETE